MNKTDWSHDVMGHIDPALVEEADLPARQRVIRFRPTLLLAACLALLLIGTAVAAGTEEAFPSFLNYFRTRSHPTRSGYTNDGWEITVHGDKIPLHEFSVEVQAQPTGLVSRTMMSLDSWEEAEELTDRELMDNPVLEGAEIRARYGFDDENGEFVHCNVLLTRSWVEGELSRLGLNTSYDVTFAEGDPTTAIHLDASFHTEAGTGFSGWAHYVTGGSNFVPSKYTTPSGLKATILEVNQQIEGTLRTDYHAYFTYNGGVWHISSFCAGKPEQSLTTLMQILDAFR